MKLLHMDRNKVEDEKSQSSRTISSILDDGQEENINPDETASSSRDTCEQSATTVGQSCHHKSLDIKSEFNLIRTLTKSKFGKVILAKKKDEKMVLKVFQAKSVSWDEFQKELNYNYFLSPHPNIVTSYNVSFEWKNSYIFVQEYASFGDLDHFNKKFPANIGESQVKSVAQQLSSALDFMHGINLVHGDVILENILVFKQDLSLVKLCDFGSTQPAGTLMVRRVSVGNVSESTFPPEICDIIPQEKYYSSPSSDVWQLGICLLTLLSGITPWNVADITDSNYLQFHDWLRRKSLRMPEPFKVFTPRLLRLMKRLLEPKPTKRCAVREVLKYMKDSWIEKQGLCLCRKCPSTSSVVGGRHNSLAQTPNPSRKGSNASTSSFDKKRRSISPSIATSKPVSDVPSVISPGVNSIKIIIGPHPTEASTETQRTEAGRHVTRTKSLMSGREPCRRHTIRDISPSAASMSKVRNNYTMSNGNGGGRLGMRRCTSYELHPMDEPTTKARSVSRTPSTHRKSS